MITEQDLQAAIAECNGERNPNANTCIKLAAFYTIRDALYGKPAQAQEAGYSFAAEPPEKKDDGVILDSGSEFADAINGMDSAEAWALMDELMDAVRVLQPRLYAGVMRKLRGQA